MSSKVSLVEPSIMKWLFLASIDDVRFGAGSDFLEQETIVKHFKWLNKFGLQSRLIF